MNKAVMVIRLLRVHHWIKNGFVFAAILFAGRIHEPDRLLRVAAAFLLWCLGASAVYIFNDLRDRDQDRQHPAKAKRPIAAGWIKPPAAAAAAVILAAAALGPAWALGWSFAAVLAGYMLLNTAYSMFLKHVVIIDIFCLAAGFVLRVMGGGFAARVENSSWMMICTVLLALFLGFAKRRHEIVLLGDSSDTHRKILEEYSTQFLDQMIAVVTASTVICYMLYTMAPETIAKLKTTNLIYTVVFVLYGIFRYLYLVYKKEEGGSPTRLMMTDIPLIINVVLWAACSGLIIYMAS